MATQNFKRKLAAILHADVKGYPLFWEVHIMEMLIAKSS